MKDKRDAALGGEIHLRQTVQMTVADQTRTLEIAVTLPLDASSDDLDRAVQQAQSGMTKIANELERHIAHLQGIAAPLAIEHPNADASTTSAPLIVESAAPVAEAATISPPSAVAAPTAEPSAVTSNSETNTHAVTSEPQAAPNVPEQASPAAEQPFTTENAMTMSAFLKAAAELGYPKGPDVSRALGVKTLTTIDREAALTQLRALANGHATPDAQQEPPTAATATPLAAPRGFAEEHSSYDSSANLPEDDVTDSELATELGRLDDLDEPDFGPIADEDDGVFAADTSAPNAPDQQALRIQGDAQRRLRELRTYRAEGAVATNEQRSALINLVIAALGKERAQDLIVAIWNPKPGEKLNAARTRALVEWSKEDDLFDVVADAVIALVRQPVPMED